MEESIAHMNEEIIKIIETVNGFAKEFNQAIPVIFTDSNAFRIKEKTTVKAIFAELKTS